MLTISSPQNPKIKECLKLRNSHERRESRLFLIEGARELRRALARDYVCRTLFFCPSVLSDEARLVIQEVPENALIEVSEGVFQKLAVRESTDGLLGVMEARSWSLEVLSECPAGPPFLVLENVEKPGNLGALARSADGVGASALIVLDPKADLFNPAAVRASVGALFSLPLIACTHDEFYAFCQERGIAIVTASPYAKRFHDEEDLNRPLALVLGSEARGLSKQWDALQHISVKIPMLGLGDSLNVSVAGAIILYENLRQRRVKN